MVFPSWLRLTLGIVLLAVAAFTWLDEAPAGIWIVSGALGALFLHAWVRYADVPRAARAYNRRDREEAFRLLAKTPFGGRLLARSYRVYYHQVRGFCLMRWDRAEEAAREAEQVLRIAREEDRRAASHTTLAEAYAHLGRNDEAREHVAAARSLDHNKALDRRLAEVESSLG